jgi:antitoxin VapB
VEKPAHSAYTFLMDRTLPADTETERLARNIAEATGKPLATVVKEAIAARAEAVGVGTARHGRRKGLDRARINAIIARSAARPVLDARTPDEIIGYNAYGLPE